MKEFLKDLEAIIEKINGYLADYILVFLLVGVGVYFTIRTRFVQVRCFGEGLKNVFRRQSADKKKGVSSFQAFTTAVAAQVGTGNIIGACSAILVGGPGAIFWMWIIAFFGMATIYAEAVIAQKSRKIAPDGTVSGGPVYYIKMAFRGKFGRFLAVFFAIAAVLSLGFVGSMVQSNAISKSVANAGGFDYTKWGWIAGIVIAALAALIFIGGARRVASATEKIVPIMAIVYLLSGLIVLGCQITAVPKAFWYIIKYAFTPNAIIGGGIGYALKKAVSMGAKRGLFSNEAGMGSTPHAHALADVKDPHTQGTVAMVSVFIDTFIVLTMTALIVITALYVKNPAKFGDVTDDTMVQVAIGSLFDFSNVGLTVGAIFVAVCLAFFAFSTILSWNLFGRINFEYLFGKKSTIIYSILAVLFILLGALLSNGLVWNFSDFFNYLMVIPNAIALIALSKMVISESKHKGKVESGKLLDVALSKNKPKDAQE